MSRTLPAAVEAAATATVVRLVWMVKLSFPSGLVCATSAPFRITWGGDAYLGVGKLGAIDGAEEGAELQAYQLRIGLSGIQPEHFAAVLGQAIQHRPATVMVAFLDADHALAGDPVVIFRGRMDTADIELGETASITVTATSRPVDARGSEGRASGGFVLRLRAVSRGQGDQVGAGVSYARRPDWPPRLAAWTEAVRDRPFAWGTWDCLHLAAEVLEALTGEAPPEAIDRRGAYADAKGAEAALRELGFACAADLVTAVLGDPAAWSAAWSCDLVERETEAEGAISVCLGDRAGFASAYGLLLLPMSRTARAWRIGH